MLSFSIAPAIAPHTLEFLGRQLIVERSSGSTAPSPYKLLIVVTACYMYSYIVRLN